MKPKRIESISDLPDESFFDEISLGYEKILKNALQLDEDASLLKTNRRPSCRILSKIAEEEAAKCLILLDAVRCPHNMLKSHLKKFSDHIAKGVYAESCYWSPRDFEEFKIYVEDEKKREFVDGPSGVEYVFKNNRIMWDREENMYVDYIETDDGKFVWLTPSMSKNSLPDMAEALFLSQSFHLAGCTSPVALKQISDFWKSVVIKPETTLFELTKINHQMLKFLDEKGLLKHQSENIYTAIANSWSFPMFSL